MEIVSKNLPLLLTFLLPILAIIATLIAPRFTGRAALWSEIKNVVLLNRRIEQLGEELKFYSSGKELQGNVYLLELDISNVGRDDIDKAHFIDAIRITLPPETECVSAVVVGDNNQDASCTISDSSQVDVIWSLLKRKESVDINVIVLSPITLSDADFNNQTDIKMRLKNVENANRKKPLSKQLMQFSFVFGLLMFIQLLPGLFILSTSSKLQIVTKDNSKPYILPLKTSKNNDAGQPQIKICKEPESIFYWKLECDHEELRNFVKMDIITTKNSKFALPWYILLFTFIMAVPYYYFMFDIRKVMKIIKAVSQKFSKEKT